ncbi:hypothetical protein AB0B63_07375 [Micromonospora sp. NPDC049081]|uniref:hypothetical protein n=1 Tax=Micromonospora sp. NPDC049081 TaxID=3155150 RepID=UPI0033CF8428
MRVHDFEGWLAESLAAQPWAGSVSRWSADGGPKPVGVTLNDKVRMQFVKAESGQAWTGTWEQPPPAPPVDASPADPVSWAAAVADVIRAGQHPGVKAVLTYAEWGGSTKPGGVRVELGDNSQLYGSILTGR